MPVADYGEDQDQGSDDQQAGSLQRIDTRTRAVRRFIAWRHGIIVAPRMLNYAALRYVVAVSQPRWPDSSIRSF